VRVQNVHSWIRICKSKKFASRIRNDFLVFLFHEKEEKRTKEGESEEKRNVFFPFSEFQWFQKEESANSSPFFVQ